MKITTQIANDDNKKTIFIMSLSFSMGGWSQTHNKLCICFDESNSYINTQISKDSTSTSFGIIKEGFESKSARDKAIERYKKSMFEPEPIFYFSFFSVQKPKIITLTDSLCQNFVELNEFRKTSYQRPKGTRSDLFIFLQKLSDNRYLKWDVLLMPEE